MHPAPLNDRRHHTQGHDAVSTTTVWERCPNQSDLSVIHEVQSLPSPDSQQQLHHHRLALRQSIGTLLPHGEFQLHPGSQQQLVLNHAHTRPGGISWTVDKGGVQPEPRICQASSRSSNKLMLAAVSDPEVCKSFPSFTRAIIATQFPHRLRLPAIGVAAHATHATTSPHVSIPGANMEPHATLQPSSQQQRVLMPPPGDQDNPPPPPPFEPRKPQLQVRSAIQAVLYAQALSAHSMANDTEIDDQNGIITHESTEETSRCQVENDSAKARRVPLLIRIDNCLERCLCLDFNGNGEIECWEKAAFLCTCFCEWVLASYFVVHAAYCPTPDAAYVVLSY